MKYIWIVMLALIEIVWFLSSIIDIYKRNSFWYNLMERTRAFIIIHLVGLFLFSLFTWIGVGV